MSEILLVSLIAWIGFASTSLDSLFLLVPLFASQRSHPTAVMFGYWLGLAIVVLASWGVAHLGERMILSDLSLLGLVPIGMGVVALLRGLRPGAESTVASGGAPSSLGVAALTLSMSGDNFGVFIPLFSDTSRRMDLAVAINLIAAAGVWCALALRMSRTDGIRAWSTRWGPRLVPFLLIAVGSYILFDTPTDAT